MRVPCFQHSSGVGGLGWLDHKWRFLLVIVIHNELLVPDSLSCWRSSVWPLVRVFCFMTHHCFAGFLIYHAYGFVWLERVLMSDVMMVGNRGLLERESDCVGKWFIRRFKTWRLILVVGKPIWSSIRFNPWNSLLLNCWVLTVLDSKESLLLVVDGEGVDGTWSDFVLTIASFAKL